MFLFLLNIQLVSILYKSYSDSISLCEDSYVEAFEGISTLLNLIISIYNFLKLKVTSCTILIWSIIHKTSVCVSGYFFLKENLKIEVLNESINQSKKFFLIPVGRYIKKNWHSSTHVLIFVLKFWKQLFLWQRTKNALRNIAGHLFGTWKKMTTTKELAKSGTRRTTCTRDGNVNASGSSGTFLPPQIQTLHLALMPSSDHAVRAGPVCARQQWTISTAWLEGPIIHADCYLSAFAGKQHLSIQIKMKCFVLLVSKFNV